MPMPSAIASLGEWMATRSAVYQDVSLVGMVQAVEDAHQGRLARAVFAQQGMDLSAAQVEIHPVVRHKRAESLVDVAHFDGEGHGRVECQV